jgi:hypothetical protein
MPPSMWRLCAEGTAGHVKNGYVVEEFGMIGRQKTPAQGCGANVRQRSLATRDDRILWLLNHTTLMEWEVPMLISLGFEVFVPKQLPVGPNSRTARVTDRFDATLTIPAEDLQQLNSVNFYDAAYSATTARLLNRHFATAISASIFPGLYYLLRAFQGRIFMRAFGHAGAFDYESATATIPFDSLDRRSFAPWHAPVGRCIAGFWSRLGGLRGLAFHNPVTHEMARVARRLHLAAAYEEIIAHERPFLKSRSVFLPLALPESMFASGGRWQGGEDRVLFICPNIDQIDYYRRIYLAFKEACGDIPHWIAGRQDLNGVETPLTTQDPSILGYISREHLDGLISTCVCMFYHSQEPRHLHYHPLEAIAAGQPLIFMAGGLLESLGGRDQPGLCRDVAEVRGKIDRLRRGDGTLRDSILIAQKRILRHFQPAYCEEVWRREFLPRVRANCS